MGDGMAALIGCMGRGPLVDEVYEKYKLIYLDEPMSNVWIYK